MIYDTTEIFNEDDHENTYSVKDKLISVSIDSFAIWWNNNLFCENVYYIKQRIKVCLNDSW